MELAVIFDLDGVLIDSSANHEKSWELLATEEGLPLPKDHFKRGFGRPNRAVIPEVLMWSKDPAEIQRLGDRKEVLYRQTLQTKGVVIMPGAKALVQALVAQGVPCAIGSSTCLENIQLALAALGAEPGFRAVVSAEDVSQGKPAPDVFLKAAQKLAVPPQMCVVIEDAPAGVEAALAADMTVLALTTSHSGDNLAHAHHVAGTLADVTPALLASLVATSVR